jgi:four helix bundle protein
VLKGQDGHKFPFEKLQVWQSAKEFVKRVYCVTNGFPATERFGLAGQIQRAAVSVMSNIAEGSARKSRKDQAHFSQLAYSSLMEAACQLQLAQELGFCNGEEYEELRKAIQSISSAINALYRSQLHEYNS